MPHHASLSPQSWFESRLGACEEVASDMGLGGGFRMALRFSALLSTGWGRVDLKIKRDHYGAKWAQIVKWPCISGVHDQKSMKSGHQIACRITKHLKN